MGLDNMSAVVAAIVTTTDNALVAFNLLPEGVLATCEDETHGDACTLVLLLGLGLGAIGHRRS